MISILDPRALIAAIALCAASVGIGYWRGNVAGVLRRCAEGSRCLGQFDFFFH